MHDDIDTAARHAAPRGVTWTVHGRTYRLEASKAAGRPTFELFLDDEPAIRLTDAELRSIQAAHALLAATDGAASKPLPPRAGRPWTPEDDERLAERFRAGEPVSALARQFERSPGSIDARLARLGLIDGPEGRWGSLRRQRGD